jgi:hypothetical protein
MFSRWTFSTAGTLRGWNKFINDINKLNKCYSKPIDRAILLVEFMICLPSKPS